MANNVIYLNSYEATFKDSSKLNINAIDFNTASAKAVEGKTGDQAVLTQLKLAQEAVMTVVPAGTYTDS